MKNHSVFLNILFLALILLAASCKKDNSLTPLAPGILDVELGIEAVPSALGNSYTGNFDRYTKVVAPNGKPIHIVAQRNITNEQIVRCRSILEHFLKDLPNSTFGSDKNAIANKMADNNAILTLLNGRDDGSNSVEVEGQPLFEEEIQVEGHTWYVNQQYDGHRDAAYEEILHLVHDYGIGVDGANSNPGAAPEFQTAIRTAQKNALDNQLWGLGASDWINELSNENSLSQEYLAAVIDVYYGLWGAFSEPNGMWGLYVAKTRADISIKDPMGQGLLNNQFFHPYLTYNARIDQGFTGTFSLRFDATISYTHHARYLKDITLLGSNDTKIIVNELDNDITGNEGMNTVIFSGSATEYEIITSGTTIIVRDKIVDREGENTLRSIEHLQFADQIVDL